MEFLQGFFLISSILMMGYMSIYAYRHKNKNGGIEFFFLMVFSILWSLTNFMESFTVIESEMIFWRNVQQIFVFSTPFISLLFVFKYSLNYKYRKVLFTIFLIQLTSVIMVFTDQFHHLVREEILFLTSEAFGKNLLVVLTPLGITLVSFNFSLGLIAIIILINYRRKINSVMKKRVDLLALSFFLVFLGAFIKLAFLDQVEFFLSISVLYIPGALLMFFVLFKYDFLNINPIGRDQIFEYINQGIIIADQNRIITDVNSMAQFWIDIYLNQINSQIIGKSITEMFGSLISKFGINTELTEDTFQVKLDANPEILLKVHRFPFLNKRKEMIGLIIILTDITSSKNQEQILEYYASHDRLTDTLNRITFENLYEDMLYKETSMISMIMIDIDNFKRINDSYGHVFGDKILKELAKTIKLSTNEIFGRLGGEEFGIILPSKNRQEAYIVAEKIRKVVEKIVLETNNKQVVSFTISLGVSDNEASLKLFEYIRHEADTALYQAKDSGKNKTVIFYK